VVRVAPHDRELSAGRGAGSLRSLHPVALGRPGTSVPGMDPPRVASHDDQALVAGIAARGFQDDPVMSWVFPDRETRPRLLKLAFWGLAERHLAGPGLIHVLDEACAAFWRPPVDPSESKPDRDTPEDVTPRPSVFDEGVLDRFRQLEEAMSAVHPTQPHWYLGVLSTIPERQNQGIGARTLAPVLDICDTEGMPAYLESSNSRNLPFYWRAGFEPTGEIKVPEGPTLFPMWRHPQSR
jgi:GNAT superfamily N-acetyltransferase